MIYEKDLIGRWKYEDKNRVYHFYPSGHLIVKSEQRQKAFTYRIENKNGSSYLYIDNTRCTITNLSPNHICFLVNKSFITIWRIKE